MKKLGFGLMRLPRIDPDDNNRVDIEAARQMVDRYMEAGFNYFDTAYFYHGGNSEGIFGQLIGSRYPRESFVVTTKMPVVFIKEAEEYPRIFAEQLERCQVEYFDNYFLHCIGKSVYEDIKRMKGFEFLMEKKAEGKIKHIGFSFHDDAETLDMILSEHPEVEIVQIQVNYADWESDCIQSRKCYEVCRKYGVDIAIMEPLKGGALAALPDEAVELLKKANPNASIASWGIRFAASLEGVFIVLSGMSDMQQLEDNMAIMDNFAPITADERKVLENVVQIINDKIAIPCTGCRYCIENCPKNIPIPDYFSLYNNQNSYRLLPMHSSTFRNLSSSCGKPSDCIECRQCEEHCPQHLAIVDGLKLVKGVFEN